MRDHSLYILIYTILLLCSAYFSASETSFSSLNIIRLETLLLNKKKNKNHHSLELFHDHTSTLSIVLVFNNVINIISASISVLFFDSLKVANPIIAATTFTTISILIFGEFLPKIYAKRYAEKFVYYFSFPLWIIYKSFLPITHIITKVFKNKTKHSHTEKELLQTIAKSAESGELESDESILIKSALKFDDTRVSSVYTKWKDATIVKSDQTVAQAKKIVFKSQHSRLPVVENKKVVGYVSVYDLLNNDSETMVSKFLRPIDSISQNTYLDDALEKMQFSKMHILIVTKNNKSWKPLGLVTLEDLMEEIVGEIYDETDITPKITLVGHNKYVVEGSVIVKDVFNKLKGPQPLVNNIPFNEWCLQNMSKKNRKLKKIVNFNYDRFTIELTKSVGKINFFQVKDNEN